MESFPTHTRSHIMKLSIVLSSGPVRVGNVAISVWVLISLVELLMVHLHINLNYKVHSNK